MILTARSTFWCKWPNTLSCGLAGKGRYLSPFAPEARDSHHPQVPSGHVERLLALLVI